MVRFLSPSEYSRDYYNKYKERMRVKSLECYHERKRRKNIDKREEFNRILSLITTKCDNYATQAETDQDKPECRPSSKPL